MAYSRAYLRNLRGSFLRKLGFSEAKGRDVDLEQAFLRVIIAGAVLLYAGYVALTEKQLSYGPQMALAAATCVELAGLWMVWWFKRHSHRPASMRYFGICADLIPLTIGLWGTAEPGVPVIAVYLWVTVGNGFRFGTRYLLAAYWLSLVCFSSLVLFVPFWQQHGPISVGFGLVLATIPLYTLVLLSRLTAQKDAAVQLSNAKSRFVANVSHELRTPLTGVFAVYDLLQRRALPPDERELVGSLGNAIGTLRSSVDAVLQMSKLEAGAERAESQLFSLRFFLQQLNTRVSPQALARNLAWSVDIDEFVPSAVLGDPNHLQHILGNLVNNALKFTPKGSVTLRVQPTRTGVRFEVTDTGIGIPLEKQESLFERFVQVDQSATRKYGGTGLGTSIAHDLVKLMHGDIGVTSAPGHGSTFWVELPLHAPEREFRTAGFDSGREVLVLGHRGSERDQVTATLVEFGLKPVPLDIDLVRPPSFNPKEYLAAVLVLPAIEAAAYSDSVLRERTGKICPWVIITKSCTTMQEAVLLRSGAVDVIPQQAIDRDLLIQLSALVYRLDVPVTDVAPPVSGQLRSLKIMLADDNRSNQLLLGRILTDAGHSVRYVARGDEAFDSMVAGNLDLAILDLNMPEMTGPDVVKLFRSGEVGSDVRLPIIILSADATPAARSESLNAGANDFLTKPVTASTLLSAIERLIEGSKRRTLTSKVNSPQSFEPRGEKSSESPSLVDQERIEALRRIGNNDRAFLDQFSEATFEDLESAINDLRVATSRGDIRGAREALHKIDGTSASIGATALGASAKNMRNYLSGTSDSDVAAALAELSTTCALTKSAVVAVLHQPRVSSRNASNSRNA